MAGKLFRALSEACHRMAQVLLVLAGACFVYMWVQAFLQGAVPGTWGQCEGNHGPWRQQFRLYWLLGGSTWENLRVLWSVVLAALLWAFACCTAAFLLHPNRRAALTGMGALAVAYLYLVTHCWLVD